MLVPGLISLINHSCLVWAWKHDYVRHVISVIADRMCTVRPTKYSEILELDRKVRDYKISPWTAQNTEYGPWNEHPAYLMMSLFTEICKQVSFRIIFWQQTAYHAILLSSPFHSQELLCKGYAGEPAEPRTQPLCSFVPCSVCMLHYNLEDAASREFAALAATSSTPMAPVGARARCCGTFLR